MSEPKERTYSDAEVAGEARGPRAGRLVPRRRLAAAEVQHRRLAADADGRERHRLPVEAAWHHADLAVTWGKLWVKLKTHSAGGITDKDFELARKIEEVVLWRPAGGALGHRQPEEVRVQ